MNKKLLLLIVCGLSTFLLKAQQTVGLFVNQPTAYEGYTLFAPVSSQRSLLIDNCGRLVHSWESDHMPGLSAYLLEDGNLLRSGRVPNGNFGGGGQGGLVELFDWDGNLLWQYRYANDTLIQHHDIEYLPNGNVLLLGWESISRDEVIALGRNPLSLNSRFWFEHIVEVEPIYPDSGTIVWKWSTKDHLIQNLDTLRPNFGDPALHPEKIDLNYFPEGFSQGTSGPDWVHANSIDYHPGLDQILICSRHLGEIWVIDHSTTTEEAASDRGGRYGKGGDLLYRWGNPATYGRGSSEDKQLFGPHDANWIPGDYPGGGQIMIFNNGIGQPGRDVTSVITIQAPIQPDGSYEFPADTSAFDPVAPAWEYDGTPDDQFFARNLSGANRLPNGNTLICDGPRGHYLEVDTFGQIVWSYVNPLSRNEPIEQGNAPGINSTFRVYRYGFDHPAFSNKDLTPGEPLELTPLPFPAGCETTAILPQKSDERVRVGPNPFRDYLRLQFDKASIHPIRIFDVRGNLFFQQETYGSKLLISTAGWPQGIYFLMVGATPVQKLIKIE